jgi:porin
LRSSRLLAAAFAVYGAAPRADAQSASMSATQGVPFASSLPDLARQITDWNGARSKLEQAGLKFTFTYFGDAFANPVGGVKQGVGYDGRFGTIIDADLEKLVGWSGVTFHASIHQIHGTQFSASNLNNLMTVSGIEAPPSTRLFNLWLAKDFGKEINLRAGQFTAAQEFLVSQNANLFVNSTFGWPVLNAQDLPSGGPAYPEATPGIRLQYSPNDSVTVLAAVFNGDPAGPGAGNPVQRDPSGLAFRIQDPPFLIAEVDYSYGQKQRRGNPNQEGSTSLPALLGNNASELPGTIKLGAWLHAGQFADQQFNTQGMLLATSGGAPLQHRGDYAFYGVLDQTLWTSSDKASAKSTDQSTDKSSDKRERTLSLFLRGVVAPTDRNLIDFYADGGLTFKGLLTSRPDDTIGLGLAYGHISSYAAANDTQVGAMTGLPFPVRDFEAAAELTYQWVIQDGWYIQPNLQYIIHPGGNIPNPAIAGTTAIPDALVLGTRLVAHF